MKKIFATILLGAVIACSSVDIPKAGETARVNQKCFAATSEAAYKELTDASNKMDEMRVNALVRNGLVRILYTYETVKVKHNHVGYLEVECDGKTLFVKDDFFARKR